MLKIFFEKMLQKNLTFSILIEVRLRFAKSKHTAGVWVEVEFQFDDCSQSIVTFS